MHFGYSCIAFVRMKYLVPFTVIVLLFLNPALAQRRIDQQELYWLKYSARFSIKRMKLKASVEDRRYIKNNRQHMWLYTLDASGSIGDNWNVGGGLLRWTINMPSDPESEFDVRQGEWRPFQYLTFTNPISTRFTFNQRFLIEQRIRQNVGKDELTNQPLVLDGYYAYLRFRHRMGLSFRMNSREAKVPMTISISNEVMVHFGGSQIQNTFDQNRIVINSKAYIFDNTAVAFGYLNWYQQSSSDISYVRRHIVTVAVSQSF